MDMVKGGCDGSNSRLDSAQMQAGMTLMNGTNSVLSQATDTETLCDAGRHSDELFETRRWC